MVEVQEINIGDLLIYNKKNNKIKVRELLYHHNMWIRYDEEI